MLVSTALNIDSAKNERICLQSGNHLEFSISQLSEKIADNARVSHPISISCGYFTRGYC